MSKAKKLDIHGNLGEEVEIQSIQKHEVWVGRVIGVPKALVVWAKYEHPDGKKDFGWLFVEAAQS